MADSLGPDLKVKSVLIATDFSEASVKPLRHALAIARHYGSRICVAHVVSSVGFDMVGPEASVAAEELVRQHAVRLEEDLAAIGALEGLQHKIIIQRGGDISKVLQSIIRHEHSDLLVIGTHARHGLGKLIMGSTAEQIFRSADCMVLTIGPCSYRDARVDPGRSDRTFLFATDFSEASLHALPFAISSANRFCAKLVLLNVVPTVPMQEGVHWYTADDVIQLRENAKIESKCRLEWELEAKKTQLAVEPEFLVEFGIPSKAILEASARVKPDTIILGLHGSKHIGAACRMPWATAYEVVCGARCPVLTLRAEVLAVNKDREKTIHA